MLHKAHDNQLDQWQYPGDNFREKLMYNDDKTFSGKYTLEQNGFTGPVENLVANVKGPFRSRESIGSDKSLYQIRLDYKFSARDSKKSDKLTAMKDLSNVLLHPKSEGRLDDHLKALRSMTPILKGLAETLSKAQDTEATERNSLIHFSLSAKPAYSLSIDEFIPSSIQNYAHPSYKDLHQRSKTTKSNSNRGKIIYGKEPTTLTDDTWAEALKPLIIKIVKYAQNFLAKSDKEPPHKVNVTRRINVEPHLKKTTNRKIKRKNTGWEGLYSEIREFNAIPIVNAGGAEEAIEVSVHNEELANYLTVTGAQCLDTTEETTERKKSVAQLSSISLSDHKENKIKNSFKKKGIFERKKDTLTPLSSDNITVATGDEFSWDSISPRLIVEKVMSTSKTSESNKPSDLVTFSSSSKLMDDEKLEPKLNSVVDQTEEISQKNEKKNNKDKPQLIVDLTGDDAFAIKDLLEQVFDSARKISENLGSDIRLNISANRSLQSKLSNAYPETLSNFTDEKKAKVKKVSQEGADYSADCCHLCGWAPQESCNDQYIRYHDCNFDQNVQSTYTSTTLSDKIAQKINSVIPGKNMTEAEDTCDRALSGYRESEKILSLLKKGGISAAQMEKFLSNSIKKIDENKRNKSILKGQMFGKKFQDKSSYTFIGSERLSSVENIKSTSKQDNSRPSTEKEIGENVGRRGPAKTKSDHFNLDEQNERNSPNSKLLVGFDFRDSDSEIDSENFENKQETGVYEQSNKGVHSLSKSNLLNSTDEVLKSSSMACIEDLIKSEVQNQIRQSLELNRKFNKDQKTADFIHKHVVPNAQKVASECSSPLSLHEAKNSFDSNKRSQIKTFQSRYSATNEGTFQPQTCDSEVRQSKISETYQQNCQQPSQVYPHSKLNAKSTLSVPKKSSHANSPKSNIKKNLRCSYNQPKRCNDTEGEQWTKPNTCSKTTISQKPNNEMGFGRDIQCPYYKKICKYKQCQCKRSLSCSPYGSIKCNLSPEPDDDCQPGCVLPGAERQSHQQDYNERLKTLICYCKKSESNGYCSPCSCSESNTWSYFDSGIHQCSMTDQLQQMAHTVSAGRNVQFCSPPIKMFCHGMHSSCPPRNTGSSWSSLTLLLPTGRGSCQHSSSQRNKRPCSISEQRNNVQRPKKGRKDISPVDTEFYDRASHCDNLSPTITAKYPPQSQQHFGLNKTEICASKNHWTRSMPRHSEYLNSAQNLTFQQDSLGRVNNNH